MCKFKNGPQVLVKSGKKTAEGTGILQAEICKQSM